MKKTKNRNSWYQMVCLLFSIYTVVVGALLVAIALHIYMEGTSPDNVLSPGVYVHPVYSTEIVAQHFETIAVLVYAFLAFAILTCILKLFCTKKGEILYVRKNFNCEFKSKDRRISGSRSWTLRITVYMLAILFVILGIYNQGMRDVFVKAANICTECIGLG